MMLLYAISWRPALVPEIPGVTGGQLSTITGDRLAMIVEAVDADMRRDEVDPLAFGRIVQALAGNQTILPVRVGTVLTGDDEAAAELAENEPTWRRRLARLTGRVELAVRVQNVDGITQAESSGASGRAYLMSRLDKLHAVDKLRDQVLKVVQPPVECSRQLPSQRDIQLALLVRREAADAVKGRLDSWATGPANLRLTCTGPWAPFSFSEEDAP